MRRRVWSVAALASVLLMSACVTAPKRSIESAPRAEAPPVPAAIPEAEPQVSSLEAPAADDMAEMERAPMPTASGAPGLVGTGRGSGGGAPKAAKKRRVRSDDPRVSRSRGERGGVVVLWPRVIPAQGSDGVRSVAAELQGVLHGASMRVGAGRSIDRRPEPERVCPRAGCEATSLGVLLVHQGQGCVAVGLVASPGQSMVRLVPWAGDVLLRAEHVPFRDTPESYITVRDFVPCSKLAATVKANLQAVDRSLLKALPPR